MFRYFMIAMFCFVMVKTAVRIVHYANPTTLWSRPISRDAAVPYVAPAWAGSVTCFAEGRFVMFKIAVVVFALAVSGFMLWIAHEDANFAQLPHVTFVKRAV